MHDGELTTVPDHDTDLHELMPGAVGADEHDHVIVLTNVGDREPEGVQHVGLGDPVAVRRLDDDRLLDLAVSLVGPFIGLLVAHHSPSFMMTRLLAARLLA